jgi:hypothetical protein
VVKKPRKHGKKRTSCKVYGIQFVLDFAQKTLNSCAAMATQQAVVDCANKPGAPRAPNAAETGQK